MNILNELCGSRCRAELLRLLFAGSGARLHLRELARRAGLAAATVRQEIRKLVLLNLVCEEKDGNRSYYQANRDHPLFPDLRNLVAKSSGLADVLREALAGDGIEVAFVFGSLARGEETGASDIDLLVVGSIGLRELSRRLSGVANRLSREINPHVLTTAEFRQRLAQSDHFLTTVLAGARIYILGGAHELAAVGGERLVAAAPQ